MKKVNFYDWKGGEGPVACIQCKQYRPLNRQGRCVACARRWEISLRERISTIYKAQVILKRPVRNIVQAERIIEFAKRTREVKILKDSGKSVQQILVDGLVKELCI